MEKQLIRFDEQTASDKLFFKIVDYSEKAIALFGDTKQIKDLYTVSCKTGNNMNLLKKSGGGI